MDDFDLMLTSALIGAVSGVLGALSGILATYWRTKYTVKAQDLSKRIEALCDSISIMEEKSCKLWNGDQDISKPYILGFKVKVMLVTKHLDAEYEKFDRKLISQSMTAFFHACTGDEFESIKPINKPDKQREILVSGAELQIALMTIRNRLY